MPAVRSRSRQTGSYIAPDLVDQAKASLGDGADLCSVADALFDAAFRSLKSVPVEHPARWAMLVGYYDKLFALYEAILADEAGSTTEGLIVVRHPDGRHGRPKEPDPEYKPGLAVPQRYGR